MQVCIHRLCSLAQSGRASQRLCSYGIASLALYSTKGGASNTPPAFACRIARSRCSASEVQVWPASPAHGRHWLPHDANCHHGVAASSRHCGVARGFLPRGGRAQSSAKAYVRLLVDFLSMAFASLRGDEMAQPAKPRNRRAKRLHVSRPLSDGKPGAAARAASRLAISSGMRRELPSLGAACKRLTRSSTRRSSLA